ncbi:hypothetical protein BBJ28_00013208 [Nothophytophthora sp. Chile5]|nr:hypothetical protein BBJ28_00013208 [Nothophytophthora sp. Chile5]
MTTQWPERVPVESLPDFDPSFMKEGFLQKKGQRLKGWKPRWFVCDGRTLSYYISRKDRKPNAVIPLEGCTVQDGGLSETWNSPRIYLTDPSSGVMYCLSAEEGPVVTQWLDVLRVAVARVNSGVASSSDAVPSQAHGQASSRTHTGNSRGRHHGNKSHQQRPLASFDDDEGRANLLKRSTSVGPPSQTRSATFKSTVSALGTSSNTTLASAATANGDGKRAVRITSASSTVSSSSAVPASSTAPTQHHQHRPHRVKTQHLPTTVALENELSHGLDVLEALLCSHHSGSSSSSRSPVVFRPIGALNGVLRSLGTDPRSGKQYARASVVLPVSSEVVACLLEDHARRADWDVHFPRSAHVATFDDATDLVHLSSDGFAQVQQTKPFVAPHIAAAACALGAALFSAAASWEALLTAMLYAAAIGGLASGVDYSTLTVPRDLLLLRHVRESAAPDQQDSNDDKSVDEMGQSVVLILEKSVVNEHKPIVSGVVRAHVGLSGWLLEPVNGGRATLATYVTDLDVQGWLSPATRESFLLSRLDCVAVLHEYVSQSQLCGAELGFGGGLDDDDERGYDESSTGYDEASEASGLGDGADGALAIFHPKAYMRGMTPVPSGGLKLIDKEVAKKQGGVLKDVIKSAGAKILEGKSAVSLSLPVRIFEPRTSLERVVDLMLFAPTFLNKAHAQTDALERFKYVMTFAVAGLQHSVGQMKPFNPILGETFQSTLNDGTDVSCEHTSHHPPISNFQLTGDKYSIAGFVLWHATVSLKSNALLNTNKGPVRVSFPEVADGLPATTITYNLPYLQIGGMMWGDRTVDIMGQMLFEDKRNHLQCELRLNPDEKKSMGGMFSSSKTPTDFVRGVILDTSVSPPRELCEVSGSWLHELRFGDSQAPYWSFDKHHSGYMVPFPEDKILASDSRYREDLHYLAAGDMDEAQEWKVRLEILQRADRKARLEGRRPNHWSLRESADGSKAGGH